MCNGCHFKFYPDSRPTLAAALTEEDEDSRKQIIKRRPCPSCGQMKGAVYFLYKDAGDCAECCYGGPPPEKVGRRQILNLRYDRMRTTTLI